MEANTVQPATTVPSVAATMQPAATVLPPTTVIQPAATAVVRQTVIEPTATEPIKLFIGQVPSTWEESTLRTVLEPFGTIKDMTVLKDRTTGVHKGCAFVTYATRESAVSAQKKLHDQITLPGMSHPMQVKPSEAKPEERRLFVGMLCRDYNEDYVKMMFAPYGEVEDVSILRNDEGRSKGAAFVRMSAKTEALQAITALHQSQTLPGCSSPLVVKIADTEREKNAKRLQGALVSASGVSGLSGFSPLQVTPLQEFAAIYQKMLQTPGQQAGLVGSSVLGAGGTVGTSVNNSFGLGIPLGASLGASLGTPLAAPLGAQYPVGMAHNKHLQGHSKQKEGPDGCNLFVYHLPNDMMDPDLKQMFLPFGNVVSTKVFIDKNTNLSKCFGFVSFDNAVSAQTAIQTMNGFQLGTKRLKVELKKPKYKPY